MMPLAFLDVVRYDTTPHGIMILHNMMRPDALYYDLVYMDMAWHAAACHAMTRWYD